MGLSSHLPRALGAAARRLILKDPTSLQAVEETWGLLNHANPLNRTFTNRAKSQLPKTPGSVDATFRDPKLGAQASRGFATSAGKTPTAADVGPPPPQGGSSLKSLSWLLSIPVGFAAYYAYTQSQRPPVVTSVGDDADPHVIQNWSGTHEVRPKVFFQPETEEELEKIVAEAQEKGTKIRPMGSGLSPNGLAFQEDGMLSLALLDKVVAVNKEKKQVTVQAGIRVQQLAEALAEHGLTLENFASIQEQQVGGFTQVSAHGTGARTPTVDQSVVALKVVTPAKGTLTLSESENPELFRLVRVGLGGLGIVTELTLQCVPSHKLVEKTWTVSRGEAKRSLRKWLREYRHMRYMWIPYTDTVVVVASNPEGSERGWFSWLWGTAKPVKQYSEDEQLSPARALMREVEATKQPPQAPKLPPDELDSLTFFELRDKLLAADPLDWEHVKKVNEAEAEFWKMRGGTRVAWSHEILQFDCGGQQWVLEAAFPAGTVNKPSDASIAFMEEVLELVEREKIAAPAPIEQRWTKKSDSPMSPGYAPPGAPKDSIHSWVGIIMYLPTMELVERMRIRSAFEEYKKKCEIAVWEKYGAVEHWAKVEIPEEKEDQRRLRERFRRKYPLERYKQARRELDPKDLLGNRLLKFISQEDKVDES